MKDINNKAKVNRTKFIFYFYIAFLIFVFVYKYIIAPSTPGIVILAGFAPVFGFLSSIVNWPTYLHATDAEDGMVVNTRRLFSKKQHSLLITRYNFDSYFETDHLHIGLNILDADDNLQKHRIKVSWLKLKDMRALEDKLREINPHAPVNEE